jgi:transposase
MEQVPRQQYTKEFREQAVRLVLEQQVTIPEAARRLTMSGRTLERWVGRARQGQLATLGETRRPVTELEAELSRLKRELAGARHLKKRPPRLAVPLLHRNIGRYNPPTRGQWPLASWR